VLFFEPKRRFWEKGEVDENLSLDSIPLHQAQVVRSGTDATVACYGPMVATALAAAKVAAEEGVLLEIVDLRSISPLDFDTVEASVRKTGRLVVAHEAPVSFGPGAELAAGVAEHCFYHLLAPVLRVGGYDAPYPPAKLEEHYLPGVDRILDAVDVMLAHG
jgi:pyruvate dehydrogenase E1 component beta subunit